MILPVIPKIKYCISSHITFQAVCLPKLLSSLSEIPKSDIIVTVGGATRRRSETKNGIRFFYVPYNAFEYSSFVNIIENEIESDYWFLLHDTMQASGNFYRLSRCIRCKTDVVLASKKGWCNLGAFRYNFLMSMSDEIKTWKNISKDKAVQLERRFYRPKASISWYPNLDVTNKGYEDVYQTGVIRKIDHYHSVNIIKYGANGKQQAETKRYVTRP